MTHRIDQVLDLMPRSIRVHFDFYSFYFFVARCGVKALERSHKHQTGYSIPACGSVLLKSRVNRSISILSTYDDELIWQSPPISRFHWATYRLYCLYATKMEVAILIYVIVTTAIVPVAFLLLQLIASMLESM